MEMVLVLDNVRSAHNVGALLRTAEGLGVKRVYAGGLTPHPRQQSDRRLPHIIDSAERKLAKTALGAEKSLKVIYAADTSRLLAKLKSRGYLIIGLEQTDGAADLSRWQPPGSRLALVMGHETRGLSRAVISQLDQAIMIPMRGRKESFNVAAAGAMAMYTILNRR